MMPKVLDPTANYTFHSYFEMQYNIADILADLGFRYDRRRLDLPVSDRVFSVARIESTLERIGMLERADKQVTQDIALYRVPENVEQLLRILIAVSQSDA